MIDIDMRKFTLPNGVEIQKCDDGSVRLIRYTKVETPQELLTMCEGYGYKGTNYNLRVHLPPPREIDTLVTVAHTSANCWKMTVSTRGYSNSTAYKTFGDVADMLKRIFK